jgi:integrase
MQRLDCDADGISRRSGLPSWPDSWDACESVARDLGAEKWLVLVLASWLEGMAETTRRTYAYGIAEILRELNVTGIDDLAALPEQAALTWQRSKARRHLPRTVNTQTGIINSLMGHVSRLGVLSTHWEPIPNIKITRGRWIDREGISLSQSELMRFWQTASERPARQFLALMMASLHGLRACEVARLKWSDVRYHRRGKDAAPAVLHVLGKGSKSRLVRVHDSIRSWIEKQRRKHASTDYILASEDGKPPSPQVVSWWAKSVFIRAELVGYAHALRATWATLALENGSNKPLEVQLSGGWKNQETMLGHYHKRNRVGHVRLIGSRY